MSTRDANTQDHHHVYQYVGPYRLEKTLGKGQTGKFESETIFEILFDFKYFFFKFIFLFVLFDDVDRHHHFHKK